MEVEKQALCNLHYIDLKAFFNIDVNIITVQSCCFRCVLLLLCLCAVVKDFVIVYSM